MYRSFATGAFALTFVSLCGSNPAYADGVGKGTVKNVYSGTFTCECQIGSQSGDWTFQTTGSTVFLLNGSAAGFGDLRSGAIVTIRYHNSGSTGVADEVDISQ
ncbi:MAG TPA: hypothetical protein VII49_09075 [Rhizomicrobium sp.]